MEAARRFETAGVREQYWQYFLHKPQIPRQWTLTFYGRQEFNF